MTDKFNKASFLAGVAEFTGSEFVYQHPLNRNITYTGGAHHVAERCEAYWLLDEIALNQMHPAVRGEGFQVWTLKVKGRGADLTCDDGNGNVVWQKAIEFTDFPLDEFKLYCTGGVIMVPSEY